MHSGKEASLVNSSVTTNQDTSPSLEYSSRIGTSLTVRPAGSLSPGSTPELSATALETQRDPFPRQRGVAMEEQPVQEKASYCIMESLHQRPVVAPKSSRVLAIAEEILRSKRRRSNSDGALWDSEIYDDIVHLRGLSRDDIYDDIIHLRGANTDDIYDDVVTILRNTKSSPKVPRPSLPPKPTWLWPRARRSSSQPGSRETWKKSAHEDIYDDVIVRRLREAQLADSESDAPPRGTWKPRPQLPAKSPMLYKHPRVLELLRQLRERRSSGCSEAQLEDIYDDILSALAKDLAPDSPAPDAGMSPKPDASMTLEPDTDLTPEPDPAITSRPGTDVTFSEGTGISDTEEAYVNLQPPKAVPGGHYGRPLLAPDEQLSSPYEVPSRSLTQSLENEQALASSTNSDSTEKERPKRTSEWSLYENECLSGGRVVQYREERTNVPGVTGRPRLLRSRSELVEPGKKELIYRRSRSSSAQFEADSVELSNPDAIKSASVPAWQTKSADGSKMLPASRRKFDPLPEIQNSPPGSPALRLDPDSDSGNETYEDLPLYEDLWGYQPDQRDDAYQDVASVVAKALDLPEMRKRATRITIGHRKQLKQLAKMSVKKRQRTQSLPTRERPANLKKGTVNSATNTGDNESSNVATTCCANDDDIIPEEGKASESGEDEPEPIPFGKSREVFEMLLDASGIERIAEGTTPDEKEEKGNGELLKLHPGEIEPCLDSDGEEVEKKENPFKELLPDESELKCYKELEAGVIYVRSRSEIEAEIRQLTENAAPEPPPLPGLQRQRTKIVTRAEEVRHKVRHKQFLIRRTDSPLSRRDEVGGSDFVPAVSATLSPADKKHVLPLTHPPLTKTHDEVSSETEPDTRDRSDSSSSIYDDIVPKSAQLDQRHNSLDTRDQCDSDSSDYDDIIPKRTELDQRQDPLDSGGRDHSDSDSSVYDDIVPKSAQPDQRRNSLDTRDQCNSDSSDYDDIIPKRTELDQRQDPLDSGGRDRSDSDSSVYDDVVPKSAQLQQRCNSDSSVYDDVIIPKSTDLLDTDSRAYSDSGSDYDDIVPKSAHLEQRCSSLDAKDRSDSDSSIYEDVIPKRTQLNQRRDSLDTRELSDSGDSVYDDVIPKRVQLDGQDLLDSREQFVSNGVHNDIST